MKSGPQSGGHIIFVAQVVRRTRYGVSSELSTSPEWIEYSLTEMYIKRQKHVSNNESITVTKYYKT